MELTQESKTIKSVLLISEEDQGIAADSLMDKGFFVTLAFDIQEAAMLAKDHSFFAVVGIGLSDDSYKALFRIFENSDESILLFLPFPIVKGSENKQAERSSSKMSIKGFFDTNHLIESIEDSYDLQSKNQQIHHLKSCLEKSHQLLERKVEEKAIEMRKLVLKAEMAYEKYKLISDNISDVIWVVDVSDYRFSYISPSVHALIGYTAEEALNMSLYDVLSEGSKNIIEHIWNERHSRFLETGESNFHSDELQFRCRNGNLIWIESASKYKRNSEGLVEVIGVSRNVEQRKKTEQRVKENEEKYRQVFAATADAMLIVDPLTKQILNVNKAAVDLYGFSEEEFLYKSLDDLTSITQHTAKDIDPENLLGGFPFRRPTDGRLFILESKQISFQIDDVVYLIHSTKDITIRIQADQMKKRYTVDLERRVKDQTSKLVEINNRFRLSLQAGDMIWWDWSYLENRLIFNYGNKTNEIRFDNLLDDDQSRGSEWFSYLHPDDIQLIPQKLHEALESENKEYEQDFRVKFESDKWKWYRIKGKVIEYDEMGEPVRLAGVTYNISRQKEMEEGMRAALEQEKILNEHKSEFISLASHQFRTPLTTILSSSELIELHASKLDERIQSVFFKHLNKIKEETHRLNNLMTGILMVDKIDSFKIAYSPRLTSLDRLCKHLIAEYFEQTNDGRTVDLSIIGEAYSCLLDPELMNQVLVNLLSNAFKYSQDSNPVLELYFEPSAIIIKVRDTGMGIPDESQAYIFTSFYRAKNVETIEGTGLGLNIVKRMVEMHSGEISFSSQLGIGTEFVVTIPRRSV